MKKKVHVLKMMKPLLIIIVLNLLMEFVLNVLKDSILTQKEYVKSPIHYANNLVQLMVHVHNATSDSLDKMETV